MPSDLLALVHRDHSDLQLELTQLLDPEANVADLRVALDGVRLGLMAHTEAEDIVLGPFEKQPAFAKLIEQARAAHRAQENAMSTLLCSLPHTTIWWDRAAHLRDLVAAHAHHEEKYLLPALRELAPERYAQLAGLFATERLRQLAMLQPSAPVYVPAYAG